MLDLNIIYDFLSNIELESGDAQIFSASYSILSNVSSTDIDMSDVQVSIFNMLCSMYQKYSQRNNRAW